MTITEFLEARIAEDEAAARGAIDPERPGQHWQWVTTMTDTVVAPGDLAEAQEHQAVSLRTVEEFPTTSGVGDLPFFVAHSADEVAPGPGEHIARWDPARVLAECAAKRAILSHYAETVKWSNSRHCAQPVEYSAMAAGLGDSLRHLAAVYSDHPDYNKDWAL